MTFKFEKLEVWQLALDYIDVIYAIANQLPKSEEYNLKSQLIRAATSIALNVAEGSTSQTDAEQSRFIGLSIRSVIETVACQRIISRRNLLTDSGLVQQANAASETLFKKLQAFRRAVAPDQDWLREATAPYSMNDDLLAES